MLVAAAAWAQDSNNLTPSATPAAPRLTFDKDGRAHQGDLILPRATYQPDPEYTEGARKAAIEGEVWLSLIVGTDGVPYNVKVVRSLGFGLTDKAIEVVKTWKFEPGTKAGKPIAMQIRVEVAFHLAGSPIGEVVLLNGTTTTGLQPYMDAVFAKIFDRWVKANAPAPVSTESKKREAWVEFAIRRDGQAENIKVAEPSDDASQDSAALKAIAAASPFQPFPAEIQSSDIKLRMQFLWGGGMEIAPPVASVISGKTQQFSVNLGASPKPPVTWAVEGPGCTGSICGTISPDGLYTAPAEVPPTQEVLVSATLQNLNRMSVKSQVVIQKQ